MSNIEDGIQINQVQLIDISSINILNPRVRNKQLFNSISENILKIGLKRPITVIKSKNKSSGKIYDLVCGQGRLETFIAAGRTEIPAMVIDSNEHDALIMSLVENLARRNQRAPELIKSIDVLIKAGDTVNQIAEKTGLSVDYTKDILFLIKNGEERLISAVENGHIPISIATKIVNTPDEEMQNALMDVYESGDLKGKKFLMAKRIVEARKISGKTMRSSRNKGVTSSTILESFNEEMSKYKVLIRKAEVANNNLTFLVQAFKVLFNDENFVNLLMAERLETMPAQIINLIGDKK